MPGLLAPGQPIPATPPAHSLPSGAAEVKTPGRWELGFTVCPENCVDVATWDPDCFSWPDGEKPDLSDAPENQNCYDVKPFVIETAFECGSVGFPSVDFAGRARRQLEAGTPKGLEYELWTGSQKPDNPNLQSGATVIGSAPFTPQVALARLGQALSNCYHGGVGVIHAPVWIVELWLQNSQIKEVGTRLATVVRGDTVIAGTGYPGTGPNGLEVSAGQAWAFATGPVQYRLGEPEVFPDTLEEALDKKRNKIEYRALRQAAINFDPCCHFGILIDTDSGDADLISV